jgi:sec-independent protein translocase protein TatA
MFGLGLPELLIILVIVVVIFGATRLPQIGKGLGEGIRNFRSATKQPPELEGTPPSENDTKDS